jgi:hypothetical protein
MAFLSALAALGGAATGYEQGKKEKEDRQLEQAQTAEIRERTNQAVLSNIQTQIMANPDLRNNPNYNKIIKTYAAQNKIPIALRGDGEIDWDTFTPKKDSLGFIKDNYGLTPEQLKEMSPDQQKFFAQKFPDLKDFFGDFTQQVPLLPKSSDDAYNQMYRTIESLGKGDMTVAHLDAIAQLAESQNPAMKGVLDRLIDSDPSKLAEVGQATKAKFERYAELGIIDKARLREINKRIDDMQSLEEFRRFEEKNSSEKTLIDEQRLQEEISKDNTAAQQGWVKIQQSADRLQIEVNKAASGGATSVPMKILQTDADKVNAYIKTLDAAIASEQKEADGILQHGNPDGTFDVPKSLLDNIQALKDRRDAQTAILGDYNRNINKLSKGELRKYGVNVKSDDSDTGNSAPAPAPPPLQFPNPPHLPHGAKYIGRGPKGGDEYLFPDGMHREYKP